MLGATTYEHPRIIIKTNGLKVSIACGDNLSKKLTNAGMLQGSTFIHNKFIL